MASCCGIPKNTVLKNTKKVALIAPRTISFFLNFLVIEVVT